MKKGIEDTLKPRAYHRVRKGAGLVIPVAGDPLHIDPETVPQAVAQLAGVLLEMADIVYLHFAIAHRQPEETRGAFQVQKRQFNAYFIPAGLQVFQDLLPGIGFTGLWHVLVILAVIHPGAEGWLIELEVKVGIEKRVVGHIPERVFIAHIQPQRFRAGGDDFLKHLQRGAVLV